MNTGRTGSTNLRRRWPHGGGSGEERSEKRRAVALQVAGVVARLEVSGAHTGWTRWSPAFFRACALERCHVIEYACQRNRKAVSEKSKEKRPDDLIFGFGGV